MTPLPLSLRVCACGTEFMGKGRAKWCSDRCRKDTCYVRHCLDCGKRLSSSDGNGPNAPMRCVPCASVVAGSERKVWTREHIGQAIREWAAKHGGPPAMCDWNPTQARILRADARAERAAEGISLGLWPHGHTVIREFGSWSNGIRAAGFEARPANGGGGNQTRNRHYGRGIAKKAEIVRLYREGLSYSGIARALPCSKQEVAWTIWNAHKADPDLPYRNRTYSGRTLAA